MKRFLRYALWTMLALAAGVSAYLYVRLHDRYPGADRNLDIQGTPEGQLTAGFAAVAITPQVPDTWTDKNQDAVYRPEDGDTYQDGNGNGRFDPVWIAGFQNKRPAMGVHDDLWARTVVLDDGTSRIAWVALDLIGFGADDILDVKQRIPASWGITYAFITSTHTHQGPDVVGLWGSSEFRSGVHPGYLQYVKDQILVSLRRATEQMRPARISFAQDTAGAKHLVGDYRPPIAYDYGLRMMQVDDAVADTALGTLIQWANHPETLWSGNLQITSDYPHYLREAFEKGVYANGKRLHEGKGGVAVFVNGAIGGMMSTDKDIAIQAVSGDTAYREPSFDKAEAQGSQLALLALQALEKNRSEGLKRGAIRLQAKTLELPLQNPLYRLGAALGIFNRGMSGWWKIRTEIALWELGPASFLHQPGELYPEIANGATEAPQGRDYAIPPSEHSPLRPQMPGEYRFIIGLSNDFIGYILPQSQWDVEPPYTYGASEAPYGEINSVGPQTAPILYKEMMGLIKRSKTNKKAL